MEELAIHEIDKKACIQCEALMAPSGKFCPACGARQTETNTLSFDSRWMMLKQAALFYGINVLSCAISKFVAFFDTLMWDLMVEVILWTTAVTFFSINWKANKYLFKWPSFSWQKLSAYCAIAITGAFLVHYSVGWLNHTMFPREEDYFIYYRGNLFASVVLVFFTAITPALFEELGFRGYLLETLLKVSDKQQAVYVSSFLFAIIHLSFISLFWLIPFALLLGFVRIKENTLWYGIFMHFCFNATGCVFMLLGNDLVIKT